MNLQRYVTTNEGRGITYIQVTEINFKAVTYELLEMT